MQSWAVFYSVSDLKQRDIFLFEYLELTGTYESSMFTNKHVILAMLIAPVLALISYFAVDSMVAEKPHAAKQGARYELVEKPNCRYSSGSCGLKNGEFELKLTAVWQDDVHLQLKLESKHPLDGVIAAHVVEQDTEVPPLNMKPEDETGLKWSLNLVNPNPAQDRLHIAASASRTLYFGDAALAFIDYGTAFKEDFRQ